MKDTEVERLVLNIGELSGVVPEVLEFAFEVLTPGMIAENALLEIITIPILCHYQKCDRNFQPKAYIYQCSQCSQISGSVISSRELKLDSIVVNS